MADQFIQVSAPGSGPKVDVSELTVGANVVERQRIVHADPNDPLGLGAVINTDPTGTEYATVVRPIDRDSVTLLNTTISGTGPGAWMNTYGFLKIVFQFGGAWFGNIIIEGSNDQSTNSASTLFTLGTDDVAPSDSIQIPGQYLLKVGTSYVRINVTYLTGTIAASVIGRNDSGDHATNRLAMALDPATGIAMSVSPGNSGGQQVSARSLPVVIASDQVQDLLVVSPASMMPLGMNAINGSASPFDTMAGPVSFKSFAIQINGSTGISGGQVTVQESNDQQSGWVAVPIYDTAAVTGTVINAATAISASTQRFFTGKCTYRYLRVLVSTAFSGGTIQCFTRFSTIDISPQVLSVGQATAANLNATVIQGTIGSGPYVRMSDGTTACKVLTSGTAAATTDAAVAVSLSPNSPSPVTTSVNQACTNVNINATGALAAVKASAGNLFGFSLLNNTASPVFVSFWNVATGSVTLGTTAPTCVFILPASGALTVGPCEVAILNSATAISFAAVTGYNGSTTASVSGSIFYK